MLTLNNQSAGGSVTLRPGHSGLVERNQRVFQQFEIEHKNKLIARIAKENGIKDVKKAFGNWDEDYSFSIRSFQEACYGVAKRRSMEAQAELVFGQLLRAGVMNTFNDIYQKVEVTYNALVREVGSNKRQEFYAPLERVGFPKRVATQGNFPETSFKGLDIELINEKTGMILSIERELIDDDMTGQIVQRAGQMGENARIYEEAYVYAKMFNTPVAFDGEELLGCQTYATPFATGTPGVSGGIYGSGWGVNQVSNGRLSQDKIQTAWIYSKQMLDQSGRPMLVTPKMLVVSPQDIFYSKILLESNYNPGMSSTQTADIGKVGGVASINPIEQLVGVVASRFVPNYQAMLMEPAKGFAFQRRDPTEMVQENPTSGPAFSSEVFRFKERARWVADYIDPRFSILINANGSST